MKLIFEKSVPGTPLHHSARLRCGERFPACSLAGRETKPTLPEMSETDISRHYTELCKQVHGVNCGFYPLAPVP